MVLAGLVGAGLRLVDLGNRPMHADEAVQALRFARLLESGQYRYDPQEYHGPSLPYLSWPMVRLLGLRQLKELEAWHLRLLPAAVGSLLVWGPWCLRRYLGRSASLAAAWFTAISPALVFYSRYYIAETLLVAFCWGAIVAWWLVRTGLLKMQTWPSKKMPVGALLLLGICLGLMYATKETWVIAGVSLAAAGWLTLPPLRRIPWHRWLFAFGWVFVAGAAVWAAFFSSFGQNPSGLLDSLKTYLHYFRQAGGQGRGSQHVYPFWYYFQVLFAWKTPGGRWWSEAAVLLLAWVGGMAAIGGRRQGGLKARQRPLAKFLAAYTVIQAFIYSAIPYKTPWCVLGFYHGMVVLAGLGWAALWQWATSRAGRIQPGDLGQKYRVSEQVLPSGPVASGQLAQPIGRLPHLSTQLICSLLKPWVLLGLVVLGSGHLALQAYRASFLRVADPTQPYLYSPTTLEVDRLVTVLEQIAQCHPDGNALPIQVFFPDHQYWPLPWYLRRFSRVGWFGSFEEAVGSAPAPVILAHPEMEGDLLEYCYFRPPPGRRRLYLSELGPGTSQWEIRAHAPIRLYLRWDLWESCAEQLPKEHPSLSEQQSRSSEQPLGQRNNKSGCLSNNSKRLSNNPDGTEAIRATRIYSAHSAEGIGKVLSGPGIPTLP